MTALRIQVRAREVRVGDEIETPNGERGLVTAIRDHRNYVTLTITGVSVILHHDDQVTATLEDGGS